MDVCWNIWMFFPFDCSVMSFRTFLSFQKQKDEKSALLCTQVQLRLTEKNNNTHLDT